jgi:aminoglycoside phosphotransferase (APT) family kinase protein
MAHTAFNPDDLVRVARMLQSRLGDESGEATFSAGPERVGHGMDTFIYGFQLAGSGLKSGWEGPLILRVFPSENQESKARRETAIQEFLADSGFPAPRPMLVAGPDNDLGLPFMIMERVPGSPMLDGFKNPLAIPGLLRRMADLQVRLHRLPLDGCPLEYGPPLVVKRLGELRELVEGYGLSELRPPLAWLDEHKGVVEGEEPCILHNDFHPLNIMLTRDGGESVLDWSDGAIGDRHHDLARTLALFWLAPPLSRSRIERLLLTCVRGYVIRRYTARYREQLPVEPPRLRYWEAFHGAHSWSQVAAIRAGHGSEMGANVEGVARIPPGFERSLAEYFRKRAGQR